MSVDLSALSVTFVPGLNRNYTSLDSWAFLLLKFLPLYAYCRELTRAAQGVLQATIGICSGVINAEESQTCVVQQFLQAVRGTLKKSTVGVDRLLCRTPRDRGCGLASLVRQTDNIFRVPTCHRLLSPDGTSDCELACPDLLSCVREFHDASVYHVAQLYVAALVARSGLRTPYDFSFNAASLDPTSAGNGPSSTLAARVVELLEKLAEPGVELRMAEIGVSRAVLTTRLLESYEGLRMLLVDNFEDEPGRSMPDVTAAALRPYEKRIRFRVQNSTLVAPSVGNGSFDLVFIDGDHSYEACRRDLRSWFRTVRSGGVFAGHDYGHKSLHGVVRAVNEFASSRSLKLNLDGENWWLYKA